MFYNLYLIIKFFPHTNLLIFIFHLPNIIKFYQFFHYLFIPIFINGFFQFKLFFPRIIAVTIYFFILLLILFLKIIFLIILLIILAI